MSETNPPDPVETAIAALASGGMVILTDDECRENEGDLTLAAEHATPAAIDFLTRHGRGLVCAPLPAERLTALELPLMVPAAANTAPYRTAFTISVDARRGVTTGISATDRAVTLRRLADPANGPDDFDRPGHVFPLRAEPGGVLARRGQTEGSLDLVRLAGLRPAAVICEILGAEGGMARGAELEAFARRHRLPVVSVAELVRYRAARESFVSELSRTRLPTAYGDFDCRLFTDELAGGEHLALVHQAERAGGAPLVRLHSECLTGDALGSTRCDCGAQLARAEREIAAAGGGILLYIRQEGRGIGLANKLRAYELQDQGLDTVEANHELGFAADARDYRVAADILRRLGHRRVRLLTNNPAKIEGLERYGIEVVERLPLVVERGTDNDRYLEVKRAKLGHLLPVATGVRGS